MTGGCQQSSFTPDRQEAVLECMMREVVAGAQGTGFVVKSGGALQLAVMLELSRRWRMESCCASATGGCGSRS